MPHSTKKTVKKRSQPKRRTPRKKSVAKKSLFKRFLLWLFLIGTGAIVAWVVYLDFQVRAQFSGKKWDVPARVYARPLELYEGLSLKPEVLEQSLKGLGYKPVKQVSSSGQFSRQSTSQGTRYQIYTRGFQFADKTTEAALQAVTIHQGQVVLLKAANDDWMLRLEPAEIGSIYPRHGEDRVVIPLDKVPPLLAESLIAVEDKYFAHHYGISVRGLARAMLANIKAGSWVQGGSTLTQQLVKNFYLTQDRHLWRKVQETVMALLLEVHYSKADILGAYMNEIYLGQSGPRGIHGFGLAASHYFNRSLDELEPHQIALLVGLAKGASFYNPWRSPKRALQRRNLVLQIMADHQLISSQEQQRYEKKSLGVIQSSQLRLGDYPAFLDLVKRQLLRDYRQEDLQSEGLKIFTTLSPHVQSVTEKSVQKELKRLQTKKGAERLQGAAIVTAIGSGEILGLVGDKNPRYKGFNRALDVKRPIGSLVKPFVMMTALKQTSRYSLASLIKDETITVDLPNGTQWRPKNFDGESHGDVFLYQVLAHSYNQATVRLGLDVGVNQVGQTLQDAGLEKQPDNLPSLLLGALELSPLEVSHLYHTLAADGVYVPLRAILSVVDAEGQPLQRYALKSETRWSADLSYLMHYNLQAVMQEGTGRRVNKNLPNVAGKTGTSNEQKDSWFAGYGENHLAVVWVGRDDSKPTPYTGSSAALPIWSQLMSALPAQGITRPQPESIDYYWIDRSNGLLSQEGCGDVVLVPFIRGSQPKEQARCQSKKGNWFERLFRNSGE